MESFKEENLEVDWDKVIKIVEAVIKAADWALAHKDEIIKLVKNGWNSVQSIINYLKKKYGH